MISQSNQSSTWTRRVALAWCAVLLWMAGLLCWSLSMVGRPLPAIGLAPHGMVAPMQTEERADGFRWWDMILRVDGQPVATEQELLAAYAEVPPGKAVLHEILRHGQVTTVTATVRPFTLADWWQRSWTLLAFGAIYALVGCLIGIAGAAQPQIRWLSYLCACFAVAATNNCGYVPHWLFLLSDCIACPGVGLAALALTNVLSGRPLPAWRPIAWSVGLGLLGWLACPGTADALTAPHVNLLRWWIYFIVMMFVPLMALLATVVGTARAVRILPPGSLAGLQNRLILAGAATAFIPPTIVWCGATLSGAIPGIVQRLSLLCFIAYPLAVLVAVLRFRLFAIEAIVRRLLVQATALSLLLGLFAGISSLGVHWTAQAAPPWQWLVSLALILMWDPARRWVQFLLDRWFPPGATAVHDLETCLQQALEAPGRGGIDWVPIADALAQALHVRHCGIALRQGDRCILRTGPATWRTQSLPLTGVQAGRRQAATASGLPEDVLAVVPIRQGERTLAALWLGPSANGSPVNLPDPALADAVLEHVMLPLATLILRDGTLALDVQLTALKQQLTDYQLSASFVAPGLIGDQPAAISTILAQVDDLLADPTGSLTQEQRQTLSALQEGAAALSDHLQSLLAWRRLQDGNWPCRMEAIDLRPLLQQVIDSCRTMAASQQVELCLQAPLLPRLHGDPACSAAALQRVLANAIQHAPSDSAITLHAASAPDALTVRIADEGPGIPSQLVDRIWLPFGQTYGPMEREQGRLGMGLPLARAWMEVQGGSLRYERDPLAGSAFIFSWRLAPEPVSSDPPTGPDGVA